MPSMFDNPFNYSLEDNTLKRRQQIADMLRQQASTQGEARFVQSPVGTFYAGGNSIGENLSKFGTQLILNHKDKKREAQRTDLEGRDASMREAALKVLRYKPDPNEGAPAHTDPVTGEDVLQEVVVHGGPTKEQALAALRRGSQTSQQYANDYEDKKGTFAAAPLPRREVHDGYLIDLDTGEHERFAPEKLETYQDEFGNLRNKQTGDLIKKVGKPVDATATAKTAEAAAEHQATFEVADAEIQGTINELRGILEKKGGGSVEDTAGGGGIGDAIGQGLGWAFGTNGDSTRFNVEQVLSQKIIGGLKQMKAAGVGTSAFNSDKEAERMEKAFGKINWKNEAEARRQLNNIYQDLLATQGRARTAYKSVQKARGGAAPSGGISLGDF